MSPERGQLLLLLLVSVAALAARLAITEPGTAWYVPVLIIGGYTSAALLLAALEHRTRWLTRRAGDATTLSRWGVAVGVLLLAAPFVEGGSRILTISYLRPLEQVTIAALLNFAFFAVAMAPVRASRVAATVVSFVLIVAALMLGEHAAVAPLTAAYSGLGVAWLARAHWRELLAMDHAAPAKHLPLAPILGLAVLLAGVTAASARFAHGLPSIWGEWVPASGGTSWANPDALLGVGDGDWVVSGPNARRTGSVDSDYFLESDLPTLYDVIMEAYGEPRTPEELHRAIFVAQQQLLHQDQHMAADAGAPGRQFSLYRKGRPSRERASKPADALLYVEGRVPLHLAMNAYERFDGIRWHEPPARQSICRLEARESDVTWMWLPAREISDFFAGTRRHQLRFGRLSSERLPLPNHPERFRLGCNDSDNVRRWALDILSWAQDGILQARQCLPPGTFLEVESRSVDRDDLLDSPFRVSDRSSDDCLAVPAHLQDSATELAGKFDRLPRGWRQIDAVLQHLRDHYEHERHATLPSDCPDPIHHFLHEARGGPAYQFATTATLALRSLGYPTRVVSGFYANPDNYLAAAGQTAVHADDAHFWIEVRSPGGDWITLDPTPGYETEWHRPTLIERAGTLAAAVAAPLLGHPFATAAGLLLSVGLWWRRLWVQERCLTAVCLWWPGGNPAGRARATLRLLDLRSRMSGHVRPAGRTPMAWYGPVDDPAVSGFVRCLYRVLYGDATAIDAQVARAACRAAARQIGVGRLRSGLGKT